MHNANLDVALKCGSSLLKKVFSRYLQKYNPSNKVRHTILGPFTGGYPGKFLAKYSSRVKHEQFNSSKSLIHHMRWNPDDDLIEYKKAFGTSSVDDFYKIAIVRQPLSQWISSYNFYFGRYGKRLKMKKKTKRNSTLACVTEPYYTVAKEIFSSDMEELKNFDGHVKIFLEKYSSYLNQNNSANNPFINAYWGFRGLNFMSFDFGLEWTQPNSQNNIQNVVDQFDLILILERLPESLILLKHLLCIKTHDIISGLDLTGTCSRCGKGKPRLAHIATGHILKKVQFEELNLEKYGVNKNLSKIIEEEFIFNDKILYNLAGKKFNEQISKFGADNMHQELEEYNRLISEQANKRDKREVDGDMNYAMPEKSPLLRDLGKYMVENRAYCGYFDKAFGSGLV